MLRGYGEPFLKQLQKKIVKKRNAAMLWLCKLCIFRLKVFSQSMGGLRGTPLVTAFKIFQRRKHRNVIISPAWHFSLGRYPPKYGRGHGGRLLKPLPCLLFTPSYFGPDTKQQLCLGQLLHKMSEMLLVSNKITCVLEIFLLLIISL